MKKILIVLLSVFMLWSCDEFLDVEPRTKQTSASYPASESDVESLLTGVYGQWGQLTRQTRNILIYSEIMSDQRLGGGATGDAWVKAINRLQDNSDEMVTEMWLQYYAAVVRANELMEVIDNVEYTTAGLRDKVLGEAYFNRACFYFDMCRLWGTVPLVLSGDDVYTSKSTPEKLFGQICHDYKKAIELLPGKTFQEMTVDERSHATRWAAQGMLARAFLFYTGYYNKTDVALPDGTTLTKDYVKTEIVKCIENSGHDLISDFRNLWPYSASDGQVLNGKTIRTTYKYANDNNLEYIGQDNNCKETVWAIKYSALGANFEAVVHNLLATSFAPRPQPGANPYVRSFPYGRGWGFGPVPKNVYDKWLVDEPDDVIRRKGSILYPADPEEGIESYVVANDTYEATEYTCKKYININVWDNYETQEYKSIGAFMYGQSEVWQHKNTQDWYVLRFADVLLMAAELGCTNAQTYMDRVRTRAGLGSVPVTPENIQKERSHEFLGEGIRYFDLMRWGTVVSEWEANMKDVVIYNAGVQRVFNAGGTEVPFRQRYQATGGFLPIPVTQINLSNGTLEQNPGWGTADARYVNPY